MEKIKTGLAAFGTSGKIFHAPFLACHPGFELRAVVERNKKEAATLYPGIQSMDRYEDLLNDPEIELVVINVPDALHFEFAHKALKSNKHVVIEKPFVHTVGQAEELINLAQHKKKILSVYHNRRWDGDSLTVRNILDQKLLGRIVEFQTNFTRYRPSPDKTTWKENGAVTGLAYNLGSHLIYEALSFFGMPSAVYADLDTFRTGGEIDDYFMIRLYYPKMRAILRGSYLEREPSPRYAIHGEKGSFVKWGTDPQEAALKSHSIPSGKRWGIEDPQYSGVLHTETEGGISREKISTLPGNYGLFYDNLYEAVRNRDPLIVQPTDAAKVIQILEAAFRSHDEGSLIEL